MTEIASLLVTIGADISDLKRGLDDTEAGIDNLGSRLQGGISDIGGQVVRTGAALNELTAPLRDFGAQGLQTASDFDSVMAEISARTGVVGADLDSVRQFALQMGADTAFSAQQAGEAFLQLLSSGQTTEEAFATLPYVLDAAAASGEDLGHTADVVTDIMASFGLPIQAITPQMQAMMDQMGVTSEMMTAWGNNAFETTPQLDALAKATGMTVGQIGELYFGTEDAADVVNILAQAAGASSADMASLGQGFANVGGVAHAFGLSVEDTAAVLAILAENGIKGAESGTALKSMLLNMSRNTDEVQGMWSSLGLSMYDAMGNARPLEAVITDLDAVLDTLPVEEQNEIMQTLAGTYGITALTALRGSISIDKMKESMSKQATASEVAQARLDTFKGRTDSLFGSLETLAIEGLTPLMNDVLTPLVEQLTITINSVTEWASENPQLTNTIVAVGGALAFAGPLLIGLGTAMTLAAPAVGLLGAALTVLTGPIGLVAAGLAGIAYIASQTIDFTALGNSIKTGITDTLENLGIDDDVSYLFGRIGNAFKLYSAGYIDLGNFADSVKSAFADTFANLNLALPSLELPTVDLSGIGAGITTALSEITIDTSGIQSIFENHFTEIANVVINVAWAVFGGPIWSTISIAQLIAKAVEDDFLGIRTFLETTGIYGTVEDAFNTVKTTVDGIIQSVFGGGGGTNSSDVVAQFAQKTGDNLSQIGQSADTGGETPLDRFIDKLRLGMDYLSDLGTTVWDNIKPGLDSIGSGIQGFITNLSGADTSGLADLFFNVTSLIGGLVGAVVDIATKVGSELIGDTLSNIGNALPSIGSAIANLISVFSDIGKGDWKQAGLDLGDTVTNFVNSIGLLFGIDLQIPDFSTALDGFKTAFEAIPIILDDIKGKIERGVNDFASGIRATFRDIEQTILEAQITSANVQIGLGINYDANVADRDAKQAALDTSNLAENLENGINTGLAAGDINIDPSQYVNVDYAALADKITNPMLIQDAMTKAMAEGDQQALDVLLPLATELGIDTQNLVDQFAASLTTAGAAQIYNATLTADVLVNAGKVDLGPLRGAINAAIANGNLAGNVPQVPNAANPAPAASAVPHLATGGAIKSEGLAYLHAGEVVLNQSQQAAVGGGKAANVTFNTQMSVETMISELERLGYRIPRGYAGEAVL